MTKQRLSPEELKSLLRYDPETGKLFWKERSVDFFKGSKNAVFTCKFWNLRFANKEALTAIQTSGYKNGSIMGKTYLAHRVIFAISHGYWPITVDHINHVRTDNRLSNLRNVSHRENCKNIKSNPKSKTGKNGVYWNKNAKKWHARIGENNAEIHLGYFENLEDAVEARKAAELKHGYHKNHG